MGKTEIDGMRVKATTASNRIEGSDGIKGRSGFRIERF
jgi:hypothetical protein